MDLTEEEVLEILKLVEHSDYDFLELEVGDLKLTVNKGGHVPEPAAAPAQSAREPVPETPAAPAAEEAAAPPPVRREGLVAIPSPLVGAFYAAPDPQAPPFVTKGSRVSEDSTVGLIEVMKVFNAIRAGAAGIIVEILVANAEMVEAGQELFLVEPDGKAE